MNEKVIRELKEEIEKLRQQLLKGGGGGGGGEGDGEEAAGLQVILHVLVLFTCLRRAGVIFTEERQRG